MNKVIKRCDKCGAIGICSQDGKIDKVNDCGGNLIQISLTYEEYLLLLKVSQEDSFLQAMADLKDKDPIEFQLKMSQFRANVAQQKGSSQSNVPKCPRCGSTSITSGARGISLAWGLIGANKTVNRCSACGHKWEPRG